MTLCTSYTPLWVRRAVESPGTASPRPRSVQASRAVVFGSMWHRAFLHSTTAPNKIRRCAQREHRHDERHHQKHIAQSDRAAHGGEHYRVQEASQEAESAQQPDGAAARDGIGVLSHGMVDIGTDQADVNAHQRCAEDRVCGIDAPADRRQRYGRAEESECEGAQSGEPVLQRSITLSESE